jgi:hypothetical protein
VIRTRVWQSKNIDFSLHPPPLSLTIPFSPPPTSALTLSFHHPLSFLSPSRSTFNFPHRPLPPSTSPPCHLLFRSSTNLPFPSPSSLLPINLSFNLNLQLLHPLTITCHPHSPPCLRLFHLQPSLPSAYPPHSSLSPFLSTVTFNFLFLSPSHSTLHSPPCHPFFQPSTSPAHHPPLPSSTSPPCQPPFQTATSPVVNPPFHFPRLLPKPSTFFSSFSLLLLSH